MLEGKGYSIWLVPKGDVFETLHDIISNLAIKYNAPKFEPHITLL